MSRPVNTKNIFHYPLEPAEELSLGDIIDIALRHFGSDVKFNEISISFITIEINADLSADYLKIECIQGSHYNVTNMRLATLQELGLADQLVKNRS